MRVEDASGLAGRIHAHGCADRPCPHLARAVQAAGTARAAVRRRLLDRLVGVERDPEPAPLDINHGDAP